MIAEKTLDLLEFNKLLGVIAGFTKSEASKKSLLALFPLKDREEIEQRFAQVGEIRRMLQEGEPLRVSPFPDIAQLLAKVRPEGAVLESRELASFIPVLDTSYEIASQLRERRDLTFLSRLTEHLTGFPEIRRVLGRSIDMNGDILDGASFKLAELRTGIRRLEGRIRKKLEDLVRDNRVSVFLQDDFITQRSGRWVIPVRMDSKGQVPGVVHDVSGSGETAFVEPLAIIHLANELENLVAEAKAEEIRILRDLSSRIRTVSDGVDGEYRTVVYLDVLNAIAQFADMLHMEAPGINESNVMNLVRARHPLLTLALRRLDPPHQVIPLDVQLGGKDTVMVITGSNAGGKTIAIKTAGLLTIMALTGMPVPADSSSSFPLIDNLLVDIGDEQSIENNLSTFSAHLSHISEILKNADPRTLILIDELGTGTDPDEGAALACAVLKEIRESGALVFATTHLADIKGFVHRTDGMINASMEFDQMTWTPLYRLRTGEPGQSHALEIARRYGLPDRVIDSAKEMLGVMKVELDRLITDLNEKRAQYERASADLEKERSVLEERERMLEERHSEQEKRQKELIAAAYREASAIVTDTRRQMNLLLEEMRKRDRSERREVLKEVEARHEALAQKLREYGKDFDATPSIDELIEGDVVYVRSLGYDAPVVEVNLRHNRLKVRAGSKEIEVPLSDVGFKRGKSVEGTPATTTVERVEDTVPSKLNLVGLRVDEALARLEPFLNHASLAGLKEVVIIHGIGKGLLSRAVREHLTLHPLVERFRSGTPSEGGVGVTVVTMG